MVSGFQWLVCLISIVSGIRLDGFYSESSGLRTGETAFDFRSIEIRALRHAQLSNWIDVQDVQVVDWENDNVEFLDVSQMLGCAKGSKFLGNKYLILREDFDNPNRVEIDISDQPETTIRVVPAVESDPAKWSFKVKDVSLGSIKLQEEIKVVFDPTIVETIIPERVWAVFEAELDALDIQYLLDADSGAVTIGSTEFHLGLEISDDFNLIIPLVEHKQLRVTNEFGQYSITSGRHLIRSTEFIVFDFRRNEVGFGPSVSPQRQLEVTPSVTNDIRSYGRPVVVGDAIVMQNVSGLSGGFRLVSLEPLEDQSGQKCWMFVRQGRFSTRETVTRYASCRVQFRLSHSGDVVFELDMLGSECEGSVVLTVSGNRVTVCFSETERFTPEKRKSRGETSWIGRLFNCFSRNQMISPSS